MRHRYGYCLTAQRIKVNKTKQSDFFIKKNFKNCFAAKVLYPDYFFNKSCFTCWAVQKFMGGLYNTTWTLRIV